MLPVLLPSKASLTRGEAVTVRISICRIFITADFANIGGKKTLTHLFEDRGALRRSRRM
jgi:hypothetical protein